ncbi:hypothetical protein A2856_02130 [Candidatus Uhrbacteria bacterium RIFCSPHIGHO2_01_FULL_63_20]|uniref:DUF721 domain-containing protein n=1 Tax=Candidatus Uhrbacteria bacterium RIFCSPHIGHO2_01_FULL_63_20 TaxID=1802385 RepID=A0A1F7TLP4_9BACT|nr:MAG: hypothetical protein A2856_02130 [Candidatus Uhrbacteria bacterium RIFCSPHIGHO2_01_FULL_63_20]
MMFSMKDLLPDSLRRAHITEQVAIVRALEGANRAIAQALPAGHGGDARAVSLREGTITVACLNSPAMHVISRKEIELVTAALREAPKADIRHVRVRLVQRLGGGDDVIE